MPIRPVRGRPPIGPRVNVYLPERLIEKVNTDEELHATSLSARVREIVDARYAAKPQRRPK
jgi:hypothetical protein